MEKLIGKYNYVKGTDETEEQLTDELSDSVEKFAPNLKIDGLKKIISAFTEKVCIWPFPDTSSPSYYMSSRTLREILDIMEECVTELHTIKEEQCQNLLFNLILDLITKGQGATHYELIGDITSRLNMEDFIEKLRGKELKRLIDAFKQQSVMEDKDALSRIIDTAMGERDEDKHREPDVHAQFLDLYIFYFVQITKHPEDLASDLKYCQNNMWYKYDREPYTGCKDIELFKRHLKIIKDVLSNKSFPRFEDEMEVAKDVFDYFLRGAAKDGAVVKAIWTDLTDFFTELATSSRGAKLQPVIEPYNSFADKISEDTSKIDSNLFETWAPKIAEMLEKGTDPKTVDKVVSRQVRDMLEKTKPVAGHEKYWIPILKGLLKYPTKDTSKAAETLINEGKLKKFWKWKINIEEAKKIIIIASQANVPLEEGEGWDNRDIASNYGDCIEELLDQLILIKVQHLVMPELALFIISSLEKRSENVNRMLSEFSNKLDFKKNKDIIPDFLKRFTVLYCDQEYPWEKGWTPRVAMNALESVFEAYKDSKELQPEVNELMIRILNFAMDDDTERIDFENRNASVYGRTVTSVLNTFVTLHCDGDTADQLAAIVPGIFKMMEDDDEDTTRAANSAFQLISVKSPKTTALKDDFGRLVKRYLDTLDMTVLSSLYQLYPHNTHAMAKHFQEVVGTLGKEKDNDHLIFALMYQVSEKQPEIFTRKNVNAFSSYLDEQSVQHQVLMIWDKVVIKNPDFLLDQVDMLMEKKDLPLTCTHFMQGILAMIAIKHKKYLTPVLKWMMDWSKNDQEQMILPVFSGMRKIADNYGAEPFAPYRKYLDKLKATKSSYVKDSVINLIDVLENRSLEGVATEVKEVREDVDDLEERVTGTEVVVGGVVQQVEKHKGEIKDVQKGVADVNKRVDDVEEDLEEVKEKVEEIDMKTMSNAPTWSRDVTKLLNPASDHDWRLLASRLGYSNDDIRGWATQSDPCMALLSEWYATHKTIEATSGVLNILQEMNRLDAAVIVENAMKQAEDVVEDEDFEYPSPPPIFLSYQWGHQNEVKLLRQHLQMAGYECWMDVGQMGGGDKLFEKIDAGIRGTKVVICCVSEKYAKSPNCNREVNLAVNLKKPMIPLQMEKISWPPVGSMGPIFSEYLYIRFYSGGGKDGKYWADTKFQELLMQLQFNNVVPDEKLITKEYKNWWIPVAEEIIVEKKDNKSDSKTTKEAKKDTEQGKDETPEVFISYQWDKQKQIQALYQRLTGLGLTCWMDIHQMGGGDSLYDKIDRGVRGCKVVLSSVTSKYALSANCRREVSLADALKKPIIPLLLENITWPPTGPMSMVLTQLLYINFCKDPNVQMKWTGPEFNELMAKLKEHIPELQSKESGSKSKPPTSKGVETSAVTTKNKVENKKVAASANLKSDTTVAKTEEKNSVKSAEPIAGRSINEKNVSKIHSAKSLQPKSEDKSQNQVKSQDSSKKAQKSPESSKEQPKIQENPGRQEKSQTKPIAKVQPQSQTNDNQSSNSAVSQDSNKNGTTNKKSSSCDIL